MPNTRKDKADKRISGEHENWPRRYFIAFAISVLLTVSLFIGSYFRLAELAAKATIAGGAA